MTMKGRLPLSYVTAYLQSIVAILMVLGYFVFLIVLFLGWARIPDNLIELGKMVVIALTNALGLMFAFLYLRSRVDGPPDPANTTIKQSTESITTPPNMTTPILAPTFSQADPAAPSQAAEGTAPKPTAGGADA